MNPFPGKGARKALAVTLISSSLGLNQGATLFSATEGLRTLQPLRREEAPAPVPAFLKVAVWCEFAPYETVAAALPELAQHDVALLLHVRPHDVGAAPLAALLRRAATQGVETRAWLLLPEEQQQLYLYEETLPVIRTLALQLADWVEQEQLPLRWLVLDCEPPPSFGQELWHCVRTKNPLRLAAFLRRQKNCEKFFRAASELQELVENLQARGFRVMGATNRMLLESARCGNVTFEDCLGIPFTMIPWDEVSFLCYRYRARHREYLSLVRRHAKLTRRLFGERGSLDLGHIGDLRDTPQAKQRAEIFGGDKTFLEFYRGIAAPQEIAAAMETARRAGLRRVNLFSLDGALQSGIPLSEWLGTEAKEPLLCGSPMATIKWAAQAAALETAFRVFVRRDHTLEQRFRKRGNEKH